MERLLSILVVWVSGGRELCQSLGCQGLGGFLCPKNRWEGKLNCHPVGTRQGSPQ